MRDAGFTRDQLLADIRFLRDRSNGAGKISFRGGRATGLSSNALVAFAYGGRQNAMPGDRDDYAACVRAYRLLPKHRKCPAVLAALRKAREAYLLRYPEERYPATRKAEQERREREWREHRRSRRNRRKRAA